MTIKINMYFLSLRLSALCDFPLNSSCFDLKVKECGVFWIAALGRFILAGINEGYL